MKKQIVKRSAAMLSAAVSMFSLSTVSALPIVQAAAKDEARFPYAMFAASEDAGAITVNAKHFCMNGDIAANGTIVTGKKPSINGKTIQNADADMLFIGDKINAQYFGNAQAVDALNLSKSNVNVNAPLDVTGDAAIKGNSNISAAIKAENDIDISGNVSNVNNSVLYSQFGDIIIDCNNVNLSGIIYAPLGNVEITANNINLNNVVVIADTITLNANNVNANYGRNYAGIAGNVSENKADYIRKYNSYLLNKDVDEALDIISEYYELTPVDTGEFSTINIFGMMQFDVKQYVVEGYGNLSVMKTDGAQQMATMVLAPFEKDLPLISTDYMYNGEQHISYIEFYGLCADSKSADYQNVIKKLGGVADAYKQLPNTTPTPAWYDEIRTMGLFKMTNYDEGETVGQMLFDSIRVTMDASTTMPQLNASQKAVKCAAIQQYSDNLVDMGGVSTDMFKMVLGVDTTKMFFNNIFFGTASYPF